MKKKKRIGVAKADRFKVARIFYEYFRLLAFSATVIASCQNIM